MVGRGNSGFPSGMTTKNTRTTAKDDNHLFDLGGRRFALCANIPCPRIGTWAPAFVGFWAAGDYRDRVVEGIVE